jgi:hypothetical protein
MHTHPLDEPKAMRMHRAGGVLVANLLCYNAGQVSRGGDMLLVRGCAAGAGQRYAGRGTFGCHPPSIL